MIHFVCGVAVAAVVGRQRATLHPADDRGATCAAVTTVSGDREPLKATGADPSRISISVPESDSLAKASSSRSARLSVCVSLSLSLSPCAVCVRVCVIECVCVCACAGAKKRGERWHFFRSNRRGQQQSVAKSKCEEPAPAVSPRVRTGTQRRSNPQDHRFALL